MKAIYKTVIRNQALVNKLLEQGCPAGEASNFILEKGGGERVSFTILDAEHVELQLLIVDI